MPADPTETSAPRPVSRHSIGRRALLGLTIVTLVTGSAATLLYGSIEQGNEFPADPDSVQRGSLLAGVSSWARIADATAADGDKSGLIVLAGLPLLESKQSAVQKSIEALQVGGDGTRRPILAAITFPAETEVDSIAAFEKAIDGLLQRNLDGVFIDCGAAFAASGKRGQAAREQVGMALAALVERARQVNPHFLVIIENAAELTVDPRLNRLIDGVSKDNLLFGLDGAGVSNSRTEVIAALHDLNRVRKSGRPVFVTESISAAASDVRSGAQETLATMGFIGRFVTPQRGS